jgi:hypothetical protein
MQVFVAGAPLDRNGFTFLQPAAARASGLARFVHQALRSQVAALRPQASPDRPRHAAAFPDSKP